MQSPTILVAVTVAGLVAWRFRLQSHPGWLGNDDARFYNSSGSSCLLIALYWYLQARAEPALVWTIWPILLVGSLLLLVRGTKALTRPDDDFLESRSPHSANRIGTSYSPR